MNQPSANPSGALYQTDLAQTPLPEILITIHRHKAPGMVECRRTVADGREEIKRIYLDRGQIIFASTNQLSESLGDKLLAEGKIDRRQYDDSVQRLRTSGKRHGVVLLEMGALTPDELATAVREQIQEIVWSIFGWESGQVTFTPGRDKHLEFVKIDFPVARAVLHGIRRIPDPRILIARLGTKATLLQRTEKQLTEVTLGEDEQRLLALADGKRMLYELVNTPPLASTDNARILYALFALELIAVKAPRQIKVQLKTDGGKLSA